MPIPPRAEQPRLRQLFPEVASDPESRTFELGLVLGGTVSAGAYTAGALDFLLEALEAWHADSDSQPPPPGSAQNVGRNVRRRGLLGNPGPAIQSHGAPREG